MAVGAGPGPLGRRPVDPCVGDRPRGHGSGMGPRRCAQRGGRTRPGARRDPSRSPLDHRGAAPGGRDRRPRPRRDPYPDRLHLLRRARQLPRRARRAGGGRGGAGGGPAGRARRARRLAPDDLPAAPVPPRRARPGPHSRHGRRPARCAVGPPVRGRGSHRRGRARRRRTRGRGGARADRLQLAHGAAPLPHGQSRRPDAQPLARHRRHRGSPGGRRGRARPPGPDRRGPQRCRAPGVARRRQWTGVRRPPLPTP